MAIVAKVVCLLVEFMVAAEAAIQCDDMTIKLVPCLSCLTGSPGPTFDYCSGVRALGAMAQTPQDQQADCNCLKSYVSSIQYLFIANSAALPDKCIISVPYPIDPKTDCSGLH